jgi:hypothetical protein
VAERASAEDTAVPMLRYNVTLTSEQPKRLIAFYRDVL